jgi:hypothetical protein
MFDGSDWTIRGRQVGRSHCIKRRSPYGPIRDLGELFIESAGSEGINEYFEYPATFPMVSIKSNTATPGARHVQKIDHLQTVLSITA